MGLLSAIRRAFDIFGGTSPLIREKYLQFLPGMILTNLSSLLLINVDAVVIGNCVGSTALAAIALVAPLMAIFGVIGSAFRGVGFGVSMNQAMGSNDPQRLSDCYRSGFVIATLLALCFAVVEVPLFRSLIAASGGGESLRHEAWEYSKGMMIALVISEFSCFGTSVLIANGRTRPLLYLTVFEGLVNLVADVAFVRFLGMGTAGAGYGTVVANLARLTATVFVLARTTEAFANIRRGRARSILEIVSFGRSTFIVGLLGTAQVYLLNRLIIGALGDSGMVIRAVGGFCLSVACALYGGIGSALGPMLGLFAGEKCDREMRQVFRLGVRMSFCVVGALALLLALFPSVPCVINGVEGRHEGLFAVIRMYSVWLPLAAINSMITLYLVHKKRMWTATVLPLLENTVFLFPLAWLFSFAGDGRYLFCGYAAASSLTLVIGCLVVRSLWKRRSGEVRSYSFDYSSGTAAQTAEAVRNGISSSGIRPAQANRIALAVEETSAYVKPAAGRADVKVHANLRLDSDRVTLSVLDDGARVGLTDRLDALRTHVVYDNVWMINAISRNIRYQYVLDMNYTTLEVK